MWSRFMCGCYVIVALSLSWRGIRLWLANDDLWGLYAAVSCLMLDLVQRSLQELASPKPPPEPSGQKSTNHEHASTFRFPDA